MWTPFTTIFSRATAESSPSPASTPATSPRSSRARSRTSAARATSTRRTTAAWTTASAIPSWRARRRSRTRASPRRWRPASTSRRPACSSAPAWVRADVSPQLDGDERPPHSDPEVRGQVVLRCSPTAWRPSSRRATRKSRRSSSRTPSPTWAAPCSPSRRASWGPTTGECAAPASPPRPFVEEGVGTCDRPAPVERALPPLTSSASLVRSISTACATSNYAFYAAANHIRRGEAEVMIAGGSEAAIVPVGIGGFVACRALSTRNDDAEGAAGSAQ
eukprot:scaffold1549_cov350-Prasinococcus_capsulatus_cf.AAC.29